MGARHPPLSAEDERLRGRGARWAVRHGGGRVPRFNDLARRSVWDRLTEEERGRAAAVAALLHHRPQLDRELSGGTLGALAQMVGEDLFDALMEAERPDCLALDDAPLPRPVELPAVVADLRLRHEAGEPGAVALFEDAARLVEATE